MSYNLLHKVSRLSALECLRRRARKVRSSRRRVLWSVDGLEDRVLLAFAFTVNLTSDTGASSGVDANTGDLSGDLLWAIEQANRLDNNAGTVINFDPVIFATPQTIELTSTLSMVLGQTSGPIVVDGPGRAT